MPFLPQEKNLFYLYEALAQKIVEATDILTELEKDYSQLPRIAEKMKNLEKEADSIVHKVVYALELEQIKVTEVLADIRHFVHNLDNVMDYLETAIFSLDAYQIEELPQVALEFFSVIKEAAQEIKNGVSCLRNLRKKKREIEKHVIKLNDLEEKADQIHRNFRREVMNSGLPDREVIKLREIIGDLEECMDQAEDVADFLGIFAMKGEI